MVIKFHSKVGRYLKKSRYWKKLIHQWSRKWRDDEFPTGYCYVRWTQQKKNTNSFILSLIILQYYWFSFGRFECSGIYIVSLGTWTTGTPYTLTVGTWVPVFHSKLTIPFGLVFANHISSWLCYLGIYTTTVLSFKLHC